MQIIAICVHTSHVHRMYIVRTSHVHCIYVHSILTIHALNLNIPVWDSDASTVELVIDSVTASAVDISVPQIVGADHGHRSSLTLLYHIQVCVVLRTVSDQYLNLMGQPSGISYSNLN